jgi:SAM-dependent methyltransferase
MNLSAWFKSKTADKILLPVRQLILDSIKKNTTILEVGCGTGDLLFRASNTIFRGVGIDLDHSMIEFANKRKAREGISNLNFLTGDITTMEDCFNNRFDISTSTLCLHEMDYDTACTTLNLLSQYSTKILIADYSLPKSLFGKFSIEVDELISGHYARFKQYRNRGEIPILAKKQKIDVIDTIDTPIDGIKLWILKGSDY